MLVKQLPKFQDNHKAHVSFDTLEFLKKHGINTYDWPPQSPEFNPIEFVWRDLKAYIAENSPTSLAALKHLIEVFWEQRVTPQYCRLVIEHAKKNVKKSFDGLNHEKDDATDKLYQK
jgi:transposase